MSTRQIIETLKSNKEFLSQNFGVESIGLFGSFARGEETAESDIDILVKFRNPSLEYWTGLIRFLEKNFNRKIDLIVHGRNLSDRFLNRIKEDIIYAV